MATGPNTGNYIKILRRRLNSLIQEARRNERALRRFQSLELHLMACDSLPDLLRLLLYQSRRSFGWDCTSLMLLDPGFEVQRLLEHSCDPATDFPDLFFLPSEAELIAQIGASHRPVLGGYDPQAHHLTFLHSSQPPASVAMLPLIRNEQPIGSLNLGSHDSDRFRRQAATDFLQHLAAVISVCLETATIRERLKHLGLTDPLTGVNNRRFFDQRLREEIARADREGSALSCLFIDIDRFKAINDAHGHQSGDQVLQKVARLIRAQLRNMDVVARYGGEEFAVLLARADRDNALEIAERIRQSIERHAFMLPLAPKLRVSASIGVAIYRPGETPLISGQIEALLLEQADAALYQAKRNGRNRVICHC